MEQQPDLARPRRLLHPLGAVDDLARFRFEAEPVEEGALQLIGDPAQAWNDSHWLARRHDLMAFLMSLYIEADQSQDANIHFLKPSIVQAVKAVP